MDNDSVLTSHFNLTMFMPIGFYSYPAFLVCFLLFVIIVSANLTIILVILRERTLHEPMYIFIAFLSVNSLYGSTGFFPRFLIDLLSETHLISRPACFTQIYVIYTYGSYEMTVLSIMAYDRYVAVCEPLHYHSKVTPNTVRRLVAFAFIYPAFSIATCVYLTVRLPMCGNKIQKVCCTIWKIAKLSCIPTVINNIVGLLVTIIAVIFPLIFVLYTYLRIILVCRRSSSEFKSKVFETCLPHTISFITYSVAIFCDVALSRFDVENLTEFFSFFITLELFIVPPLLNPLVYGLKLPEIRKHIFKMLPSSKPFS